MAEILKSKELQLGIMILSFALTFVPYFLNVPVLTSASEKFNPIVAVITHFTFALAVLSQFRRGMNIINRKQRGWYFKAYMLAAIVLMCVFSLFGREAGPYKWVMYSIINPLSGVNYCILAFYMASTCARAFRARNTKAMLLLLTGITVLLYQAPLTGAFFPQIEPAALYINNTFGVVAPKTFAISVTIGAIVFGIRVLMGNEASVLGRGKEE